MVRILRATLSEKYENETVERKYEGAHFERKKVERITASKEDTRRKYE